MTEQTKRLQHKFILTSKEMLDLIMEVYQDGFDYGMAYAAEQKTEMNWSSRGRDIISYANKMLKKLK